MRCRHISTSALEPAFYYYSRINTSQLGLRRAHTGRHGSKNVSQTCRIGCLNNEHYWLTRRRRHKSAVGVSGTVNSCQHVGPTPVWSCRPVCSLHRIYWPSTWSDSRQRISNERGINLLLAIHLFLSLRICIFYSPFYVGCRVRCQPTPTPTADIVLRMTNTDTHTNHDASQSPASSTSADDAA